MKSFMWSPVETLAIVGAVVATVCGIAFLLYLYSVSVL